ncbi:Vasopressin-neurophysin 2-copeptin [Sciurus carolinensis]|uniref:Vasopressin-neurophysin 2-copeptin n=1 Tax=Sciurus carolinensis TaxID=30640 RepID=A0AA41NJ60_SCICA|nr:Vasopressin-neurophysin 2-copeptin [Sciurus carolinensis]
MANPTANPTSKKCVDFFEGLRYQSHSQQKKMRGRRRIFINCQEKRSTACAAESLHCVNENFLTSPCQQSLKPCQKWSRCSAPGLCCNEDKCARDLACRPAFDQSGGARDRSNATQLEEPICCR